jgi:hypothetical protein
MAVKTLWQFTISSSPAGPTPSSPPWRPGAHRGPPCWTRSGLGPVDDATEVTATQLREVVARLIRAGQWRPGNAGILVVMDSGYDVTRLAYVPSDLPVELVGRLRSDRVMLRDAGPRRSPPPGGQSGKARCPTFSKAASWHTPDQVTACDTTRYGPAEALAWDRMHPRLTAPGHWLDYSGELPHNGAGMVTCSLLRGPGKPQEPFGCSTGGTCRGAASPQRLPFYAGCPAISGSRAL